LASGDKEDAEALPIRTNARVLGARLKPGEHRITIDLMDSKGQKAANALNRTDRTFLVK